MITTIQQATQATGSYLAGGTDYMDRRRHHLVNGQMIDLAGIGGLHKIGLASDGQTLIGALTTVADVASERHIREYYAGLAQAAGALATPQIRQVATIAGMSSSSAAAPSTTVGSAHTPVSSDSARNSSTPHASASR